MRNFVLAFTRNYYISSPFSNEQIRHSPNLPNFKGVGFRITGSSSPFLVVLIKITISPEE